MAYIHAYLSDGTTQISEGTGLAPLVIGPLNASNNEQSVATEVILKCQTGFETTGDTTVSFTGTTAGKWTVCATAGGSYASSLTISSVITTAGKSIFVKAAATSDESPANDASVDISIACVIAASI